MPPEIQRAHVNARGDAGAVAASANFFHGGDKRRVREVSGNAERDRQVARTNEHSVDVRNGEQIVDSLFVAAGKEFNCEPLTMDPEGRRPPKEMLNLGRPRRAWEFTSLSNERDRPALALPVAQSIVDLLMAYGWRDARPNPLTVREKMKFKYLPLDPFAALAYIGNEDTMRLACMTQVRGDLTVETKPEMNLFGENFFS